jgi:hypothetical protein
MKKRTQKSTGSYLFETLVLDHDFAVGEVGDPRDVDGILTRGAGELTRFTKMGPDYYAVILVRSGRARLNLFGHSHQGMVPIKAHSGTEEEIVDIVRRMGKEFLASDNLEREL